MQLSIATFALLMSSASALNMKASATNEDMVATINKMQNQWVAHVSPRFTNATNADVASLCGSTLSTDAGFDALPERENRVRATAVPDSFDSTSDFPGCESVIGHVRDQSSCGSCWAFGSTEAFNDRRCVAYADKKWYSAEDTTACCSGLKCGFSNGCSGGQPTSAWKFFASTGVVTGGDESLSGSGETCNPYPFAACAHHVAETAEYPACPTDDYSTPKCVSECMDTKYAGKYADDKVKAKSAYSISNEADMMEEISTHGPVTGAFTVYEDFVSYSTGVYTHVTGKQLGGHAIEIVGYGVENGVKYWKCKNSWNPTWGDGGFFKIKRGTNECGIEGTVSAGLV